MSAIDRAELDIAFEGIRRSGPDRPLGRSPNAPVLQTAPPIHETATASKPGSVSQPVSNGQREAFLQSFRTATPLVVGDMVALAISGVAAALMLRLVDPHVTAVVRPMSVVLCLLTVAYWVCGLYSALGASPVLELRQIIQVNTIGFLAAAIGGILAPPLPWWCMGAWVLSVAAVPFGRATVRRWCARTNWWGHPTLIISSGKNADGVVLALLRAPTSGFRPVAVTDPKSECRSALLPVVNDETTLEALIRQKAIRYAVVCAPQLSNADVGELFARYGALIPHLVFLSDVPDLPSLWGTSRTCGRLTGLEMRNSRMLPRLWAVKRIIDVIVASTALVLGMPLLIAIALAVKFTSRGRLFYGHSRIGFGGHWFMAWKFRTMHPDGDAVLAAYLKRHPEACDEWERDHKLRNDPRVTPIGRILRKLSFDELPQIWNVLKGEMSLVGPRPIVAKEVAKYGTVFKKYSAVKPGITGMWQVSGRSETTYDERVRLDEYYVANWSPWLDIYILAKTVIILVRRRGAY